MTTAHVMLFCYAHFLVGTFCNQVSPEAEEQDSFALAQRLLFTNWKPPSAEIKSIQDLQRAVQEICLAFACIINLLGIQLINSIGIYCKHQQIGCYVYHCADRLCDSTWDKSKRNQKNPHVPQCHIFVITVCRLIRFMISSQQFVLPAHPVSIAMTSQLPMSSSELNCASHHILLYKQASSKVQSDIGCRERVEIMSFNHFGSSRVSCVTCVCSSVVKKSSKVIKHIFNKQKKQDRNT